MNPVQTGIVLALAFAIAALGAALAGVGAAALARTTGRSRPEAVMAAARAFARTLTVIFALAAVIIDVFK
jgi:hypothetical protein